MMQYDRIEDIKQAIDLLYTSRDQTIQQTANTWLQSFQRQQVAWDLSAQLLQETANTYVFFGANTICNKIRYDFNELSKEQSDQLLNMLFAMARQYRENRTTLRNEVCLDIATLLLRWDDLTGIVSIAVDNIGASGNDYMLLNVLGMLPIEVHSKRMPIFEEQREAKVHDMEQSSISVLRYLDGLLGPYSTDDKMVEMVFTCFQAWVSLGCFQAEELASTSLLPALFQAIHIPSLFEVCSDALSEVLRWYFVVPQHKTVIDIVIPQVAQMQPLAQEAVAMCDHAMCRRIVLIFIQLGNDYILPVMDDSNTLKDQLIDTLLTLYSFPSMDIAELCVDFWQELLTVLSVPSPQSPVYQLLHQLVDASLPHLALPKDYGTLGEEDQHLLKKQRHAVGEVIVGCQHLLQGSDLFSYLHQLFLQAVAEFLHLSADQQQLHWMRVESLLYSLRLLGAPYEANRGDVLEMVNVLFALPTVKELASCSLLLLSCYGKLLSQELEVLERMLAYCYDKLATPYLQSPCVELFRSVCKEGGRAILHSDDFTNRLLHQHTAIPVEMSSSNQCTMMEGLCSVLRLLPADYAVQCRREFLDHQLQQAKQVMERPQHAGAFDRVTVTMQLLTVIIRYSVSRSTTTAILDLSVYFQSNWQFFVEVTRMLGAEEHVAEAMCRFFKYFMRLNRDAFMDMLPATVDLLLSGYTQSRIGSYLYCGSVLVGEYGCYQSCRELVLRVLSNFCDSTLTLLASSPEAYVQNPNLVEDFYDLCGRALQNIPEVLFGAGDMVLHMTQAALPGVQLQHREANNSIMRFLETLVAFGHELEPEEGELAVNIASYRANVQAVLVICGQSLVDLLIAALTGGLPESRLRDSNVSVVSVLYNLFDYFKDVFLVAVANAIDAIPERVLSIVEKERFMARLLQDTNSNINWFEQSMRSLSTITRRRTEHE